MKGPHQKSCTDASLPPQLPPPGGAGRRTDDGRNASEGKKAPFLFYFIFSSLRGLSPPLAQHASPSHGEGVVCFCGQAALLRAGGRARGRAGLCSNGWLEKVELASTSRKRTRPKERRRTENTQRACSCFFEKTFTDAVHASQCLHADAFTWVAASQSQLIPKTRCRRCAQMVQWSARGACERLNLLRSTAWQCPGVGEIWSPWGWDGLYYLLSGCLAPGIVWWRDGQAGSRMKHVLLCCRRQSLPSTIYPLICCVWLCMRMLSHEYSATRTLKTGVLGELHHGATLKIPKILLCLIVRLLTLWRHFSEVHSGCGKGQQWHLVTSKQEGLNIQQNNFQNFCC